MKSIGMGWPNRITAGRIILVAPFVAGLWLQNDAGHAGLRWTTLGVFVLMAVSDLLDGYLARRLGQESDLGRILDPIADKLLVTSAFLILWLEGVHSTDSVSGECSLYLPGWVAVIAFGKDLLVCLGTWVVRIRKAPVRVQARRLGKWCTTAQLGLIFAMLLWPNLAGGAARLPEILWWVSSGLAVAASADYVFHAARFVFNTEPNDARPPSAS